MDGALDYFSRLPAVHAVVLGLVVLTVLGGIIAGAVYVVVYMLSLFKYGNPEYMVFRRQEVASVAQKAKIDALDSHLRELNTAIREFSNSVDHGPLHALIREMESTRQQLSELEE